MYINSPVRSREYIGYAYDCLLFVLRKVINSFPGKVYKYAPCTVLVLCNRIFHICVRHVCSSVYAYIICIRVLVRAWNVTQLRAINTVVYYIKMYLLLCDCTIVVSACISLERCKTYKYARLLLAGYIQGYIFLHTHNIESFRIPVLFVCVFVAVTCAIIIPGKVCSTKYGCCVLLHIINTVFITFNIRVLYSERGSLLRHLWNSH